MATRLEQPRRLSSPVRYGSTKTARALCGAYADARLPPLGSADHLARREFFAGGGYSVADIGIYGYVHVADEAGIDMRPYANVGAWLERVRSQPRYMNDLEPYPPNAAPGAGRSLYD